MRTTRTNRTTRSNPSSPQRTTRVSRGGTTATQSPNSGTFTFTFDPSKTQSSDPYEIFREVFGKDFEKEFPESHFTVSSPIKKTTKIASPTKKSVLMTPTGSASPGTNRNVVWQKMPEAPVTPHKSSRPKSMMPSSTSGGENDGVVSMHTQSQTIIHEDGKQEVITTTITVRADGTTHKSTKSSQTTPTKSCTTTTSTFPRSMKTGNNIVYETSSPRVVRRTVTRKK